MKLLSLCAFLLLSVSSVQAAEGFSPDERYHFNAVDCVVTDVRLAEDSLTVEFRGRWSSDAPGVVLRDTDKSAVFFMRDEGSEESWRALVAKAKAAMDKRAAISIRSGGWVMMSGILFFQIPRDTVEILVLEDR